MSTVGNRALYGKVKRAQRRLTIAADYVKGMPQYEIANKYKCSQATISKDLARIREEWLKSTLIDFNEVKAREIAKIDNLEATYWEAWYRSIGEKTKVRTRKVGVLAVEATVEKETLLGNTACLAGVQWCVEQRCKIFGIYEATKVAVVDWRKVVEEQGHDAGAIFEKLVNTYVEAIDPDAFDDDDDDDESEYRAD